MASGADLPGQGTGSVPGGRRIFAVLTLGVNSLLAFATLLTAPAPEAVGFWELALAAGTGLAVLLALLGVWAGALRITERAQLVPLLLLPAFGLPVVASALLGAAHGVPAGAIVRATLPYAAFLPLVLLGLMSGTRQPRLITIPLVAAGVAQSGYLLWLFFARVPDPTDVGSVWIWRTTLVDPRTTLPLLLATAAIPLAWRPAGRWGHFGRGLLVALPLAAALSTQTRSQVLAVLATIAVGMGVTVAVRLSRSGMAMRTIAVRAAASIGLATLLSAGVLLAVPQTRALLGALVLRTQADADTGRIYDEWIPALGAVARDGPAGLLAGIGAGESFITAGGEPRTYVHNLLLYALVYFGAPGLASLLAGYATLAAGLLSRARLTGDPRFLALAAMLGGMFLYAQFFAVHKLFSYNLMLALCGQALAQPVGTRDAPG